ncbi:MAG: DUF2059 domain-containing protein [Actinomycetota bacterium]
MLKKIALTFFIVSFALISRANAQTEIAPEKQAAIKELVTLINGYNKAEDLVKIFSRQMETVGEATINAVLEERTDLTAAEKKSLRESLSANQKEMSKRYLDKMMQKLNYNEMINDIASIVYDKYYTLDEIRDLLAFYKTPTGQKTLKTMTPLLTDTLQLTQERLVPKIPVILREIQDEEKQDIEREINARKPKPKKSVSK